ncbi:hypothetical protein [Effusibacillus consociatus]|uniref:DUF5082 domain-containing protein n=1 Tax=Effusibacillus consociatus TaxID=1117041 RepID=A0ABV9Q751_9BACL
MSDIYSPWYEELFQLKKRLDQIEEELKKLREQSRVGTIEYHIENLTVESIQNGILDLGVHMGNETDKRIMSGGGDQEASNRKPLKERVQVLEGDLQEVKDKLQGWEERLQTLEKQSRVMDERLRYLEAMHP